MAAVFETNSDNDNRLDITNNIINASRDEIFLIEVGNNRSILKVQGIGLKIFPEIEDNQFWKF